LFLYFLAVFKSRFNSQKEIQLIKRIASKDEDALEQLYDLYSKILYSIIIKIVKQTEDAEEILQNVFLLIWNKASSFDFNKGNVCSWLITIARNKAIDKFRSSQTFGKACIENIYKEDFYFFEGPGAVNALDAAIASERAEKIKDALNSIPVEQKDILELAYFEGYTQKEISEKLKMPLGTVKSRTKQGILKLYKLLNDYV
jgi:RNA polymerase sigma-70 factor, ECF subfamily